MRWMPIAIAMLGCGGQAKPTPENHGNHPRDTVGDKEAEQETTKKLCKHASDLAGLGCTPFDRMDPDLLSSCNVVSSFQLAGMDRCLYEKSCADLAACFEKTRATDAPPAYTGPTRKCTLPKDHKDLGFPAAFSPAEIEQSYGRTATTYADAPSTKNQPIEVCGFPAAGSWLARMTCKDGSHPLPTRNDAERVRVDNVGEGGRCGRIIDHYAVECPEMTYEIFIDSYRCPG